MTHRILFVTSGFFFMFTVFGAIMAVGSLPGDGEGTAGHLWFAAVMATVCCTLLASGMVQRSRFRLRLTNAMIAATTPENTIDAGTVASLLEISLDDARDVLQKHAARHRWSVEELGGYDARYYIS
jgi:hypothetical protein